MATQKREAAANCAQVKTITRYLLVFSYYSFLLQIQLSNNQLQFSLLSGIYIYIRREGSSKDDAEESPQTVC